MFPDKATYEDIDAVLDKLSDARQGMVKAGRFDGSVASVERELEDLKKVPFGSELRNVLFMKDYAFQTFDQFVDMVRQYQSTLSR